MPLPSGYDYEAQAAYHHSCCHVCRQNLKRACWPTNDRCNVEGRCTDDRGNCGFRQTVVNLETSGALVGWRERGKFKCASLFWRRSLRWWRSMARRAAWSSKVTYEHHCEWNNHPSPADALRIQAPWGPSRGAPGLAHLRTCVNRCKSCSSCCIYFLTKTVASFLPLSDSMTDGLMEHMPRKKKDGRISVTEEKQPEGAAV